MPNGQLVTTMNQTAGRGQLNNKWESEKFKNLTFSIGIIDLDFPVKDQFQLNIISSMAIAKTLNENFAINAAIKWPNDILIGGKKVCGILVETTLQKDLVYSAVIGVGLNVNQERFETKNATSLINELGQAVDLEDLLIKFCENLEHFIFRKEDLNGLKRMYMDNLFQFKKMADYVVDDHKVRGEIIDISERGELIVNIDNEVRAFQPKKIKFVL